MRYLYGEADEKFIKVEPRKAKVDPLSTFKFRLNDVIQGKADVEEFDKTDVPLVFKFSPDTLLNLCVRVLDAVPLPAVYSWTIEDICKWLRGCGFPQYQNTFRVNLITGHELLLVNASALAAMNIKNFDHIKALSESIRSLFYYEIIKFGRCITLYPQFHHDLYKLFRLQTGAKYDLRRSEVWRRMQLIRRKEPNYLHWEILERWLDFDQQPPEKELIGGVRRTNLYDCNFKQPQLPASVKQISQCSCLPPCECYSSELDCRPPWRLQCLPHLAPDSEFVENCGSCLPPCTCRWSSKKYETRGLLSCLRQALPHKYGGYYGQIRYRKYEQMLN